MSTALSQEHTFMACMELRIQELHEWLRVRDGIILYAQERLAAHGETLSPAYGAVTLQRLRLLEDVKDLAEMFAREPGNDERRRELMLACDKARRA